MIKPEKKMPAALRKGQTAIEYLLVTASMLFVFVMMYRALQYSVTNQFKRGGMVILKTYTSTGTAN